MSYAGEPTDIDVEIALRELDSGRELRGDDAEYVRWVCEHLCISCRRGLGYRRFAGLCISCSAALEYQTTTKRKRA